MITKEIQHTDGGRAYNVAHITDIDENCVYAEICFEETEGEKTVCRYKENVWFDKTLLPFVLSQEEMESLNQEEK